MKNIYDIIIIGAGISGLVAAQTIIDKEPSLDIIILEAKDRIGGRTLSLPVKVKRNNTCLFDFGAHWVSSSQTHLQKYLQLLDLKLIPQQKGLGIAVSHENSFEPFEEHPIVGNALTSYEINWFFSWLEENSQLFEFASIHNEFVGQFYDSITMEYYINSKMHTADAKNVAKNIIRTTTGVEASQITVMYYLLLCNSTLGFTNQYMHVDGGGREYWIEEGAYEICNRLQEIIGKEYILLQKPVTEIDYSRNDYIKIETSTEAKYYCTRLICTVPPEQILKIDFKPELSPHKKFILNEARVGHMTIFVITFKKPFWRYRGYSGEIFACDDGPIVICYDASKNDNPALFGYINKSIHVPIGADETCENSVVEQLVKYLGQDANDYIAYKEHSWSDETYTGGCPRTCAGLATLKWYYTLSQPLDNRIHWAGAEIATDWNGYMNGAVQSGYRAAINLLFEMRPQCITYHDIAYIEVRKTHQIRLKNMPYVNKYTVVTGVVVSCIVYKFLIRRLLNKLF